MLKPVIRAVYLCAATTAAAEGDTLSGQQIHSLVAGATVEIDTPLGIMPVFYAADGTLSGQARELASYLGAASDSGRWWVSSDHLCHRWDHWFNAEPQCLRLRKEGRTIQWRSRDGNSGTAQITVSAPIAAAVPAHAPTAAKMQGVAPDAPRAAANTLAAAKPSAMLAGAIQPFEAANQSVVAAAATHDPDGQALPPGRSVPQVRPAPKPPADPLYGVANVARDDVLNVRSGPSTEFDVVGELQPGSRGVSITGACQSEWCPVQHHATSGWVNRAYLEPLSFSVIERTPANARPGNGDTAPIPLIPLTALRDPPGASRTCLTQRARALLERIEEKFGPMRLVSTCRPGATIAGSGRPSRHASGNAIDFDAGGRKAAVVEWLIANHHEGGTMTYPDMNHIHVDIGPHFVSIAGGRHWASWRHTERDGRMARTRDDDDD